MRDAALWAVQDAPVANVEEWAVLVVLAQQADEDGCSAFRSVATIARMTRMSADTVKDRQRALIERGLIARGDQSAAEYIPEHKRPVVYDLQVPYSWFPAIDRINEERKGKGRRPLAPEDRPNLMGAPTKRQRKDAGRRRLALVAQENGGPKGGLVATPGLEAPGGMEAPRGSERDEGGASSPTTKPLTTKRDQEQEPFPPQQAATAKPKRTSVDRGTRITSEWLPSVGLRTRLRARYSRPDQWWLDETEAYRNHFLSKTGRDATSLDWDLRFYNWIKEAIRREGGEKPPAARNGQRPVAEGYHDAVALARRLHDEEEAAEREQQAMLPMAGDGS